MASMRTGNGHFNPANVPVIVTPLPRGTADKLISENEVTYSDVGVEKSTGNISALVVGLLVVGILAASIYSLAKDAAPLITSSATKQPAALVAQVSKPAAEIVIPTRTPQPTSTPRPTIDRVEQARLAFVVTEQAATQVAIDRQIAEDNRHLVLTQAAEYATVETGRYLAETKTAAQAQAFAADLSAAKTEIVTRATATAQAMVDQRSFERTKNDAILYGGGGLGFIVLLGIIFLIIQAARGAMAWAAAQEVDAKLKVQMTAGNVEIEEEPTFAPQPVVQVNEREGYGAMQYPEPVSSAEKALIIKLLKEGRNISLNEETGMLPLNKGRFSRQQLERIIRRLTDGEIWATKNPADGSVVLTPEGRQLFGLE